MTNYSRSVLLSNRQVPGTVPHRRGESGGKQRRCLSGVQRCHSRPQSRTQRLTGRTRWLHLHLRCLHLLLAELLRVDTETHAGLLLTEFLHLPHQHFLLGCVELVAPALLRAVTLAERQLQRVAGSILCDVVVGIDVEPVIVFVREDEGSEGSVHIKICVHIEVELNMFTHFKRFLRDAQLIDGNKCTDFSALICDLGWESDTALALMLVNLSYENAQFEWYISQMDIGYFYESKLLKERLMADDMKEKAANSIVKSFKRIVSTPFGTVLNFGYVTDDDDMVRTKCSISDNRVVLYALYKFAEKCNLDKEFHISYLYDENVERDGVSPVRLFGLYDEEELKSILLGLSSAYPEFINATFTNDLQTITLRDKTSNDVLNLFKEELYRGI